MIGNIESIANGLPTFHTWEGCLSPGQRPFACPQTRTISLSSVLDKLILISIHKIPTLKTRIGMLMG